MVVLTVAQVVFHAVNLEWGTRIAVENSPDDSRPPERMAVPRCDLRRWS